MEKSVDTAALPIFSAIRETFDIRKGDIRTYSPLTLAYIGDGIYDLVIRSMIVAQGNTCLLYTSPSPRDSTSSRMPSSA